MAYQSNELKRTSSRVCWLAKKKVFVSSSFSLQLMTLFSCQRPTSVDIQKHSSHLLVAICMASSSTVCVIDRIPMLCAYAGRASVDGSFPYGLRRAHGALNVFAWGVLMRGVALYNKIQTDTKTGG